MEFYTKAWKEYIYENWKGAIAYCFYVTAAKNFNIMYEGNYNEELKNEYFNKYYELKQKYVSISEKLEEEFGKYEKISLLDINEERKIYDVRIDNFVDLNKSKVLEIIKILEDNDEKINLDINDVDFKLLALGKVNSKTFEFYKNLRNAFCKLLETKKNLLKEYSSKLKDFELIIVDVNAFLTSYSSYLKNKDDEFYEFIKNRSFHDMYITKYEVTNKQVIIEIDYYINRGIRLTINNPQIRYYQEIDDKFELVDIEFSQEDIRDIYTNFYENYEDVGRCLVIEFFVKINGRYELIKGEYIADMITGEEFVVSERLEKYVQQYNIYQENLKTISNIIDNNFYQLLKEPYFNKLNSTIIESYTYDKDLIFNYRDFLDFSKDRFSLKFIDASVSILKDEEVISKEVLFDILKERVQKYNKQYKQFYGNKDLKTYLKKPFSMSFVKNDDLIESRVLIEDDIEIKIICKNIELLNNNFGVKPNQIKIIG